MPFTGQNAITTEWVLVGISFLFIAFRVYVRIIHQAQRFILSDYLIFTAWLAFVSCCACDTELNHLGLMQPGRTYTSDLTTISNDPKIVIRMLKIIYGSALPYYLDLWFIKAALLCFFYTIIPPVLPKHRMALYIVTAIVGATFILVMLINSFWCLPVWRNWTLNRSEICFSFADHTVFFISVASNILTDLMILALPFPLLRNLHVQRGQLYGLIFIFALGGICIIASIARCIALAMSATVMQVAVCTGSESAIGIMVACSPALRVLLRKRTGGTGYTGDIESVRTPNNTANQGSKSATSKSKMQESSTDTDRSNKSHFKSNNNSLLQGSTAVNTMGSTGGSGIEWISLEEKTTGTVSTSPRPVNFSRSLSRDEDDMTIEEYLPQSSLEFLTMAPSALPLNLDHNSNQPSRKPSDEQDWLRRQSQFSSAQDSRRPSNFLSITSGSSSYEELSLPPPPPLPTVRHDDISHLAQVQRDRWEAGMQAKYPSL